MHPALAEESLLCPCQLNDKLVQDKGELLFISWAHVCVQSRTNRAEARQDQGHSNLKLNTRCSGRTQAVLEVFFPLVHMIKQIGF